MKGSINAERLMTIVNTYYVIDKKNYNKAYGVCMDMKVVYANAGEEAKVLFVNLDKAGITRRK